MFDTKIGLHFFAAYNSTFAIGVQFVSVWRDFSGWLIRFPKLHLSINARPSQMRKTLCATVNAVYRETFSRFISTCWHKTFSKSVLVNVLKTWHQITRFNFAQRQFFTPWQFELLAFFRWHLTLSNLLLLVLTIKGFKEIFGKLSFPSFQFSERQN